jgi:hypothetical protein
VVCPASKTVRLALCGEPLTGHRSVDFAGIKYKIISASRDERPDLTPNFKIDHDSHSEIKIRKIRTMGCTDWQSDF